MIHYPLSRGRGKFLEKWLHVFRIRCEHRDQADLFAEHRSAAAVIVDSFQAHPEAEVGAGSEWHIAASNVFAGNAVEFQIGRVQSIKSPQYDDKKQIFYEEDGERAPYVHGVFDSDTQSCVIEKKSQITAKASEVALKLEKLLNAPPFASKAGFRIVVDELRDPEGFIEQIRQSESVTRFQFVAEFENPHDVYNLIHGPAERYNEEIGGQKTTVETRGPDLNKDVVEAMARSAASVGDPASATIREAGQAKGKTIYLRGTPLLEKLSLPNGIEGMRDHMLGALRSAYARLRQPLND